MTKLGIAINVTRCTGCKTCVLACKMQNNVPMGMNWNRIENEGSAQPDGCTGTYPDVSRQVMPVACQHCENAPCVENCPTGASYKDEMGRVLVNYDACIGCKTCLEVCPYDARSICESDIVRDPDFNYGDQRVPVRGANVAEKCTLCKERTDDGNEPMCVVCCPMKARIFGDLDDPSSEISKVVEERGVYQLKEEAGTAPQIRYFD
ncbi:4Fe-4S dicluster domain-containing protein [Adlercreutzia shanghongiae]|uniref:4Fe-4S dicluster domain-containing protein n=1 Tax=Adlercreutzia shanghongiae TaxID=3111773 RepID=A0ABU6IY27_9ACTN|nr:4Fe-4S dicluster domain-containing protein [Adlercreutzia sp. R22]MEC4294762.1 4Fe-4S dicluster domain-containing protein [Adlercreutzia sp. R22]